MTALTKHDRVFTTHPLKDAAAHLGTTVDELRARCDRREVPHTRLGKSYRVSGRWLAKQTGNPLFERARVAIGSVVYFIRCGDFVKVGYATNVVRRVAELQTGNPHELELLGVIPGGASEERTLHALLAAEHHRGEWFRISGDTIPTLRAYGVDVGPGE